MKVLLVANEFFSWGIYGGFGAFTRKLGRELVKRGVEVDAVVHKISSEQKPVGEAEVIDGVNVVTLPRNKIGKLRSKLYCSDADVIHSQCGMLDTYLTFKRNQKTPKVVTVQDFRSKEELYGIDDFRESSFVKQVWALYFERRFYGSALRMANQVCVQAKLLIPKLYATYGISDFDFLPNFIDVPEENTLHKSSSPSVVWLGRLDEIKRPELCFETAKLMPGVDFYVLGFAHDKQRDAALRRRYSSVKNLYLMGFQDGRVKESILSKAWVLINTSVYECLPVSFLEALAHKCALLSTQNPDGYVGNYGCWAASSTKSLTLWLQNLVENDLWRGLGEKGYEHVKAVHSTEAGVENHLKLYRSLLE